MTSSLHPRPAACEGRRASFWVGGLQGGRRRSEDPEHCPARATLFTLEATSPLRGLRAKQEVPGALCAGECRSPVLLGLEATSLRRRINEAVGKPQASPSFQAGGRPDRGLQGPHFRRKEPVMRAHEKKKAYRKSIQEKIRRDEINTPDGRWTRYNPLHHRKDSLQT